jgi:putative transposase
LDGLNEAASPRSIRNRWVKVRPGDWEQSGYREIQKAPKRYAIIDLAILSGLNGFTDVRDFQTAHRRWVEQGLENGLAIRDDRWSEAVAVGGLAFVETMKKELGVKAKHRNVIETNGSYALREATEAYGRKFATETEALSHQKHLLLG